MNKENTERLNEHASAGPDGIDQTRVDLFSGPSPTPAIVQLAEELHREYRKWAGTMGLGDHMPETWWAVARAAQKHLANEGRFDPASPESGTNESPSTGRSRSEEGE